MRKPVAPPDIDVLPAQFHAGVEALGPAFCDLVTHDSNLAARLLVSFTAITEATLEAVHVGGCEECDRSAQMFGSARAR